ncbi:VOC family protein [Oerskovia sp. NPDC060338]|uniref:VOC family protein n=1 Tax=Oerskovia sp. NPDC060338 TaxID=3347100 RepID=UPI00364B8D26
MIRLENATYLVHDLDDAIAFFTDALGFTLRQDETFEGGWRRVVVGPGTDGDAKGTGLVLALATSDDARSRVGRQAGDEVAFFLQTDDFATQHARMLAHGVRFREEPRHEAYGTVAIFEDLYGTAWDLIEPPSA